jgi:ABC-type bacteriocin/lantibiotic exporter with double-glycine peptidase domain
MLARAFASVFLRDASKPVWKSFGQQRKLVGIAIVLSAVMILLQLPLVFVTRIVVDNVLPNHRLPLLNVILIGLILFMVVKGLLDYLYTYVSTSIRERGAMALQMALIRHLQSLGIPYIKESDAGYLAARMMGDANSVANIPIGILVPLIRDILTLAVATVLLILFQWRLLLFVTALLPGIYVVSRLSSKRIRSASQRLQEATSQLWGKSYETVSAVEVVTACCAEDYEAKRFDTFLNRKRAMAMEVALVGSVMTLLAEFGSGVTVLVVLGVGGRMVMEGKLTLGSLIAFNVLLGYLISPIQGIVGSCVSMQSSMSAVDRITEIMLAEPTVTDSEHPSDLPSPPSTLTFENVSFSYKPDHVILDRITLSIPAYDTILIVGENGAGKSTLARLIPRFYDPCGGRICIDGVDLRAMRQHDLRSAVALVPQNTTLLQGTIEDNVCFGISQPSRQDKEYASWASTTDELIERSSDGWSTLVGERGVKLSGGERQRVALGRALVRRPALLILDEAASEFDLFAELELYRRLRASPRQMTLIVIDHKMTICESADQIVVLEGGRIVDCGRHDELITRCESYRKLESCRNPRYKLSPAVSQRRPVLC